jgi:hypothetical protein
MLLTMESKTAAHHKLETLIAKGRETAGTVIDHVMKNQPTDRLARASALQFQADHGTTAITVAYPDGAASAERLNQRLHRNALVQMAHTSDLPLKFIDGLQDTAVPWSRELLVEKELLPPRSIVCCEAGIPRKRRQTCCSSFGRCFRD